jgi:hypothetical protein
MSVNLKDPKDGCKKGMPSDWSQLMCVTSTVFLCSWVQQPFKDMTSLGTDFETHAIWQGYIEETTGKDFVARKARTITLSKAQGTHWNVIKFESQLGNRTEAVIGQATISFIHGKDHL